MTSKDFMPAVSKLKDPKTKVEELKRILEKMHSFLWSENELNSAEVYTCIDALESCSCFCKDGMTLMKINSVMNFLQKVKIDENDFFEFKSYRALSDVSSIETLIDCVQGILKLVKLKEGKCSLSASNCALLFKHFTTYFYNSQPDNIGKIIDGLQLLYSLVGSGVMNDAAKISIKYAYELRSGDNGKDSTSSLLALPTSSPPTSTSLPPTSTSSPSTSSSSPPTSSSSPPTSTSSSSVSVSASLDCKRFQHAFLEFRKLLTCLGQIQEYNRPSTLGIIALAYCSHIEEGIFFPEGTLPPLQYVQEPLQTPGSPSSVSTQIISPPQSPSSQAYFKATFVDVRKDAGMKSGEGLEESFRGRGYRKRSRNVNAVRNNLGGRGGRGGRGGGGGGGENEDEGETKGGGGDGKGAGIESSNGVNRVVPGGGDSSSESSDMQKIFKKFVKAVRRKS